MALDDFLMCQYLSPLYTETLSVTVICIYIYMNNFTTLCLSEVMYTTAACDRASAYMVFSFFRSDVLRDVFRWRVKVQFVIRHE